MVFGMTRRLAGGRLEWLGLGFELGVRAPGEQRRADHRTRDHRCLGKHPVYGLSHMLIRGLSWPLAFCYPVLAALPCTRMRSRIRVGIRARV